METARQPHIQPASFWNNTMHKSLLCLVLFMGVTMLSGCGIIDSYFLSPPENTARELAEAGTDAMQEKNYGKAVEYFTMLKDRYPFSPYTTQAELALADAYFHDEQYMAAEDSYKEFEALHPRHEAIPYVLFQIGRANYMQFKSIDRPQTQVEEGLQYFLRLQETYPGTQYAEKAGEFVIKSRTRLAEHELYVADFYWRRDSFGPAWNRYKYVAEEFPDLPEIQEYARRKGELAYLKLQLDASREIRERDEGTWKKWFKWL